MTEICIHAADRDLEGPPIAEKTLQPVGELFELELSMNDTIKLRRICKALRQTPEDRMRHLIHEWIRSFGNQP